LDLRLTISTKGAIMKRLAFIAILLSLSACSNLSGKSAAYQAEHQRAYAAAIDGKPGGMDAVMWANYLAHEAAEAKHGK